MVFQPSQEIHDRMRFELSCTFIDRSLNEPHLWLVAKLPMNLLREIWVGAPISLRAWVVEIDEKLIAAFGLTVFDDPIAHRTDFGSCRSDDEAADLRTILAAGTFPVQFFNENFLPILFADCRFDPDAARGVCELVPSVGIAPEEGLRLRERATDVVQVVVSGRHDPQIRASCDLPLTLYNAEPMQIHLVGIGDVNLIDTDEGGELERLTLQAFESLFPFGAFISPQVDEGKRRRELCDVLAVSRKLEFENEGLFVIQNKVASATADGLKRTTERRVKSIQKNIQAGIGQLEGAIKALRAGKTVYRIEDGTPIEVDPPIPGLKDKVEPLNLRKRANEIGQGIVLISDMHDSVDWEAVFFALGRVFLSTRYYCHVLDLQEMMRLIIHSKRRPALLEHWLLERGRVMLERRSAFVRFQFQVEEGARNTMMAEEWT